MIWKHRLAVGRRSASTDRHAWVESHEHVSVELTGSCEHAKQLADRSRIGLHWRAVCKITHSRGALCT